VQNSAINGVSQLAGWGALALLNQLLLLFRGSPPPSSVRLLHHAYDAGQLLSAGVVSFLALELARRVADKLRIPERATLPRALALAFAVFVVSLLTVRSDVTNAAGRYRVPVLAVMLAAALFFALLLGATPFLNKAQGRVALGARLTLGLSLGIANAFLLPGNYPALHLMLAWLAALVIAAALDGILPAPKLARRWQLAVLGALALASLATLLRPPPQAVLGRLYSLPSAALAPFVARFYPEHPGPALELVRREFLVSPWFQDRSTLPPVPPSHKLTLSAPPIVILLTIDALRADVVSQAEHLARFPGFAALHEHCAYFSHARSSASSTRASLASVFSGQFYSQLRCDLFHFDHEGPRLPALLSAAGIRTVSLPRLNRLSIASGVGVGFQTEVIKAFNANSLVNQLIEYAETKSPSFFYAHFGEPHAPYQGKGSRFERYLQEVGRVDRALQRFFDHLKQSGLAQRTLLIVTADHGEGFAEHGVYDHARIIYEEVARVPLFLCGPRVVARSIAEPVSLVDLAPTILDTLGLGTPGVFMGQSLVDLALGGNKPLSRPIAISATHGLEAFYFRDGKKVLFNVPGKTVEVYDLNQDAAERVNLVGTPDPSVRSAVETARLFFHQHRLALARQGSRAEGEPAAERDAAEELAEGED
jgi:hypothetical protein